MTNTQVPTPTHAPLSADSAFVVHLTAMATGSPESICGRIEHIASGSATRFGSVAELLAFMRQVLAPLMMLIMLAAVPLPAWGSTRTTCLTGDDPVVANDAAKIAAFRHAVDATCPCASFDGSQGHTHADYVRCASDKVAAALKRAELRWQCRTRVVRAFARSTCGWKPEQQAVACIETSVGGRVRCTVAPASLCHSKSKRYERVACKDHVNCVDAGDENADYLVDALDSGYCASAATPTATPASTATLTSTSQPTVTPTTVPSNTATMPPTGTPTAVPTDTAPAVPTATAVPTDTPTDTPTPTASPTDTPTASPTATPICGDGVVEGGEQCDLGAQNGQPNGCCTATCTAVAVGTACDDGNDCTVTDVCNGTGVCAGTLLPPGPPIVREIDVEDTRATLDGATVITVEGSQDNIVPASVTDPALCQDPSGPPMTFHWVVITPNTAGYTARGITGYRSDVLSILADSIPDFTPQTITVAFVATSGVPDPITHLYPSTTRSFRMLYRNSALTVSMSTTCQTMQATGTGCDIEDALAVAPGTPT